MIGLMGEMIDRVWNAIDLVAIWRHYSSLRCTCWRLQQYLRDLEVDVISTIYVHLGMLLAHV